MTDLHDKVIVRRKLRHRSWRTYNFQRSKRTQVHPLILMPKHMDSEPESKLKNDGKYREIRFHKNSSTAVKRDATELTRN